MLLSESRASLWKSSGTEFIIAGMRRIVILGIALLSVFAAGAQFRKSRPIATESQADKTPTYANPQEYFIAGIEIAGLKVFDKNAMISLTGLKIGDKIKIPGDQIATAIRKMWKHGLVGDVTISVD